MWLAGESGTVLCGESSLEATLHFHIQCRVSVLHEDAVVLIRTLSFSEVECNAGFQYKTFHRAAVFRVGVDLPRFGSLRKKLDSARTVLMKM